jgi:hypothetical protein
MEETNSLESFTECGGWGRRWADTAYPSWAPDSTNWKYRALTAAPEPMCAAGGGVAAHAQQSLRLLHNGVLLSFRAVKVDVLDGLSLGHWLLEEDGKPQVADQYEGAIPAGFPIENAIVQTMGRVHAYGTEQELADSIWRSLVGNRDLANVTTAPAPDHWVCILRAFAPKTTGPRPQENTPYNRTLSFVQRNANFIVGGRPLSSFFSKEDDLTGAETQHQTTSILDEAVTRMARFSSYRRLVTTKNKGLAGMVPHFAERGDVVFCFPGCNLPMLLREVPCPWQVGDKRTYKIVTPIYVHGIMQGEAVSPAAEGRDLLEEVLIW